MIRFDRYELDATQGLSLDGHEVRLTPKSLAVLWLLADHAGRVVTKDELFENVWRDTAVTDSALATCIQEIRQVLGDDARQPRFIETVHRRGYRFVAKGAATLGDRVPESGPPLPSEVPLIGRETEIEAIENALQAAQRGTRQVVFIIGEPGIGKTALLAATIRKLTTSGRTAATWAQCVEQYGAGEPFEPLLDALMRLCRQPHSDHVVAALERYAPMWLAQLPGLVGPRDLAALQRRLAGASRDRMLRELTNAVEAVTAHDPLILAIEDLHWSDPSTIDWIATVAARPETAKLLLLVTTRPPVAADSNAAVASLLETLRTKRLAQELALTGLSHADAETYVAARLPAAAERATDFARLARRIRDHTGGNPLFMASVLDQLVEQGVVVRSGRTWKVNRDVDQVTLGITDTIRTVIDRQVARLQPAERLLLETASVVGDTFAVAVVSAAAGVGENEAESVLVSTTRDGFIRESRTAELPDGKVTTELTFAHALYRDALYERIPRGRRTELHQRVGEFLERAYGSDAVTIAAELAVHFEQGRDFDRAVLYLRHAAENARRRSAFNEARLHYEHALLLLNRLPESDVRAERELNLRMGLGAAAMATRGFGAPEVEEAYSRARRLSQQIGDAPRLFPALWGQWLFYWGRGEVHTADDLATELRTLAEQTTDPDLRLQALHASWATSFSQGQFVRASDYGDEGIRLYEMDRHAAMAQTYGSHDVGVCARVFAARALAFMGRSDGAVRLAAEAIDLAHTLEHPLSTTLALTFAAAVDQSLGNTSNAARHAAEAVALARDEGYVLLLAWSLAVDGWATARREDPDAGLRRIAEAIAAARKSGSVQFQTYLHGLLSDASLATGRARDGSKHVKEGLAFVAHTGERFYEAELHRLRGELILARRGSATDAENAFLEALEIARGQDAGLLALRAALALNKLPSSAAQDRHRDSLRAALEALPPSVRRSEIEEASALLRMTRGWRSA